MFKWLIAHKLIALGLVSAPVVAAGVVARRRAKAAAAAPPPPKPIHIDVGGYTTAPPVDTSTGGDMGKPLAGPRGWFNPDGPDNQKPPWLVASEKRYAREKAAQAAKAAAAPASVAPPKVDQAVVRPPPTPSPAPSPQPSARAPGTVGKTAIPVHRPPVALRAPGHG